MDISVDAYTVCQENISVQRCQLVCGNKTCHNWRITAIWKSPSRGQSLRHGICSPFRRSKNSALHIPLSANQTALFPEVWHRIFSAPRLPTNKRPVADIDSRIFLRFFAFFARWYYAVLGELVIVTFAIQKDCLRWIKACGRPHEQLNVSRLNKHKAICSKVCCRNLNQ